MLKVRINREYKTLERYYRGKIYQDEWVLVKANKKGYDDGVWEIWTRTNTWRKRQSWICLSWQTKFTHIDEDWTRLAGRMI